LSPSWFFAALSVLAIGAYAGGPRLFTRLAYDRFAILHGEVWRLLTTYLVHAGLGHLVWNLAATGIVWVAVARALRARAWLAVALCVGLGSSVGVLLLRPEVRVMAGLSGLLHGLFAAGAAVELRRGERLAGLLLMVLAAKIAWEQLVGPTLFGGAVLSDRIAIHAHAYGAAAGLLAGLVWTAPSGAKGT
jgi:rhomboid family GlyGly-CTERM serine protease